MALRDLLPLIRLSNSAKAMLPGGYDFVHLVFWTVVIMVAAGTNFMAIALSVGLGLLVMEALGKG